MSVATLRHTLSTFVLRYVTLGRQDAARRGVAAKKRLPSDSNKVRRVRRPNHSPAGEGGATHPRHSARWTKRL